MFKTLASWIALFFCLEVALVGVQLAPAMAQDVDPNLLSRVESFIPTPTTPPIIPKTTVRVVEERTIPGETVTETVPVPLKTLQAQAAEKGQLMPFAVQS